MTNADFERISAMPDFVSEEVIRKEFEIMIGAMRTTAAKHNADLMINALVELSDRQWRTHELPPSDIRNELDQLLISIWNSASLDSTEKLLGIVARLGLSGTFSKMVSVPAETLKEGLHNTHRVAK